VPVTCSRAADIAIVGLDWPEYRNALDDARAAELGATLSGLADDMSLRGVVLTGTGAFCSGGDLRFFQDFVAPSSGRATDEISRELGEVIYARFQGVIRAVLALAVPVAAAIDGAAIGFGCDIALACDVRFMSDAGWLLLGWDRVGLVPGGGGLFRLAQITGTPAVWRILAERKRLSAGSAAELGLAIPCGTGSAVDSAVSFLRRLADLPPATVREYTALLRSLDSGGFTEHLDACREAQQRLLVAPEFSDLANQALAGSPAGKAAQPTAPGTRQTSGPPAEM
jgi:2-(1,2-epoxy-1,2-dihydrophenyl)acetyl-CoA isomerase